MSEFLTNYSGLIVMGLWMVIAVWMIFTLRAPTKIVILRDDRKDPDPVRVAAPKLLAACRLAALYLESKGVSDGIGNSSQEIRLVDALSEALAEVDQP